MCGICGIYSFKGVIDSNRLVKMAKLMQHRGPDDEGYLLLNTESSAFESFHSNDTIEDIKLKTRKINGFINNKYNLGLGFRRLAILDLSANGHQPMTFEEAGLHIVYNGEIYNYIEIRNELESFGYNFYSNSDTEVILKSYDKWGEDCVHKFNGMWAFAIWDTKNRKLFCSRDRFAVKPFFYYYILNEIFVFSSEIKPLLLFIKPEENKDVVFKNFAYGITNYNEETFFKGIYQLRGGHNLILNNGKIKIYKYYFLPQNEYNGNFDSAKEKLRELLFEAVKIRLRSDVEVGFALSGGIDSSSIVCIANELKTTNNHTFSMVFPGNQYDESKYIDSVLAKTKFKKHIIIPTFKDFINDLDNFVYYLEEPFDGLSYYGEYKVRQLTHSKNIKVSLDGQGGDEVFAGYPHFFLFYLKDLIRNFKFIKFFNEHREISASEHTNLFQIFKSFLRNSNSVSIGFLRKKYPYINSNLHNSDSLSLELEFDNSFGSYLNDELYKYFFFKSIPKLLISADKISMSFSLECRNPFLDFRIVEFGFSLPYSFKINNGLLKFILRESVKDLIPESIYSRKDKIGFVLPEENFEEEKLTKIIIDKIISHKSLNEIVEIDSFIKYYKSNSTVRKNWRFWKIISYLLWYEKFIINKVVDSV